METGKLAEANQEAVVAQVQPLLKFGDFQFDPDVPLLTYGSRSLELAPKALEILAILLKNAGQVVRKDDLLSLVWPQTIVEESNIAVHVSSLRKALAEYGDYGNCVETIPKRGYRFIAPVQAILKPGTIAANDISALFDLAEHHLQQDTTAAFRRASAIYQKMHRTRSNECESMSGAGGFTNVTHNRRAGAGEIGPQRFENPGRSGRDRPCLSRSPPQPVTLALRMGLAMAKSHRRITACT